MSLWIIHRGHSNQYTRKFRPQMSVQHLINLQVSKDWYFIKIIQRTISDFQARNIWKYWDKNNSDRKSYACLPEWRPTEAFPWESKLKDGVESISQQLQAYLAIIITIRLKKSRFWNFFWGKIVFRNVRDYRKKPTRQYKQETLELWF